MSGQFKKIAPIVVGDGRTPPACRLATQASLANAAKVAVGNTISKEAFTLDDDRCVLVRASSQSHLAKHQVFWGALNPHRLKDFAAMAVQLNRTPHVMLVSAVTE